MDVTIKLKKLIFIYLLALFLIVSNYSLLAQANKKIVALPEPDLTGSISLEQTINQRRSVRSFENKPLTETQISQLLWAAQGITQKEYGFRAVPSAGATYPLEIYIVTQKGVMHYKPENHNLEVLSGKDLRADLTAQPSVASAAMNMVVCAVFERVKKKYKDKGEHYAYIEAGHVGQNVHLMAVSLGLGSLSVGGFDDVKVQQLLNLDKNVRPIYIIAVGNVSD